MGNKFTYYNSHSHRKPQIKGEICIRNAYLRVHIPKTITYKLSIGLHPWFVEKEREEYLLKKLETGLKHPNVVAIGEIGLDKLAPNFVRQERIFSIQKEFASENKLPLIIHQVRSANELGMTLNNFEGKLVLHGFTSHIKVWEQLNKKQNTFVSIGAAILKSNLKLVQTVRELPADFLLVETDTSQATIDQIYQKIAEIKQCSMEELCPKIEQNFKAIFTKY